MIVTMLVLLAGTATALFSVHATTFELRASGYARQSAQTQYIAETGLTATMAEVDQQDPWAIQCAMQTMANQGFVTPMASYGEPDLLPAKANFRFVADDFPVDVIESSAIGGARQPYVPQFIVDLNDDYTYTATLPGYRSGGGSPLRFMYATYTARGRTQIPGQVPQGVDTRPYHEGAHDARAHAVSGPIARTGCR